MTLICTTLSAIGKDQDLIDHLTKNNVCIIVMRHGEATHNLSSLMNSSRSPGVYLTPRGVMQVQQSAQSLADHKIAAIYASPVFRTLQTANIVGIHLQLKHNQMHVFEDLREQYFGIYEGRPYSEYEAHFASPWDIFEEAVPEGESGADVRDRTRSVLWKTGENHPNETVLLVTHGFNCCHVSGLLTGEINDVPSQARYKVYNFK